MGIVYRAYDIRTRSFVALKTMRDATDPVAVDLFSKEWSVLASISHPNIVPIRDVGEFEERGQKKPFFVMPLLPGVTLARLIETSSPRLTVDHVIDIIAQVCRGLQAAHERGLVHRDIKPTNIFVMDDDTAQIIDFGVVYLAGTQSVTGHKGTWQYMAPEQIDLKPASPVSDLFSLGVVCYETLTGRKPFSRKTPAETADAIRHFIPPPICDINPTVSRLVSMVFHKAMAKQPIHRFTSARDFAETLQKAQHNQPIDRFDPVKIQPRIERARKAFEGGDPEFASEILTELESEGHIDPEIALVRAKIDQAQRQRKIRQLLEAARTRLEQDEIPLALEKLQEVLEIDPDNAEAHAMRSAVEKQRNEKQIESWLSLAHRHLDRHDFTEARQALAEVLKIRPSDVAALALLSETDRREQDAARIRSEKEQLYSSAMKAYQNGAISTALSRLERLLDIGRQTPDAAIPDRDAVYQGFYNQVRSDRDSIHNAYEEARRQLAERNFERAVQICDEFMAKYPGDAIFQALKLETVEQQRQELSSYIAEIGRRVEEEPDLDRKVNLLKQACERYPNEQQFQQSLKLTRERRDLVLSIVAKARHYEEKGLFTEAIGEWDTLRKIYSKYPGIDIEVTQLMKRRDQQVKDEAKTRLIEQIDRSLDSGEFIRAVDLVSGALAEHPQDQELTGLERLARQGLERSLEAGKLYDQAQQALAERRFQEAAESLRQALELDPKNRRVREALVNVLAEQARPMVDAGDWRTAEPIVQQASELDATNAVTRSLRNLVADSKRKEFVSQCLTEARELRDHGDVEGALAKVEAGLLQYPNEPRLLQLQTSLFSGVQDVRRQKERPSDIDALQGILQRVGHSNDALEMTAQLEQCHSIWSKHPDDPEIGHLAAEIRQRAETLAPTQLAGASIVSGDSPTVLLPGSASGPATGAAAQPARVPEQQPMRPATPPAPPSGLRKSPLDPIKAAAENLGQLLRRPVYGSFTGFHAVIVAIVVCLIGAAVLDRFLHRPATPAREKAVAVTEATVQIQTTPPDALVTVNGETRSGTISLPSNGTYNVVVSRLGYRTYEESLRPEDRWTFTLDPAPIHFSLSTSEKTGKIFIDDNEKADLQSGPTLDVELPVDGANHVLALRNGPKEIFSFSFAGKPGEVPLVTGPKPKDLIVVSSLGAEAVVFSGSPGLRANLIGQGLQAIPGDGLKLHAVSATNNELVFSNNDLPKIPIEAGNSPAIYVGLNADTNIASLTVQSTVPSAQLFVDGVEVKSSKPGSWRPITRKPGKFTVLVKAEGYEDHQEQIELAKGQARQLNVALTPKAVAITAAYLIVEGGTPGAEAIIDGMPAKALDSAGSARIEVSPGPHHIAFRKESFEPSTEIEQNFARGQEIRIGANEARLKEFGTLQFKITPADAQVSYRREQRDPQRARGGDSVRVPAGKYSVTVAAAGFKEQTRSDVAVSSGQTTPIEIALVAESTSRPPEPGRGSIESLFEKPEQVGANGEWWISRINVDYVFLKPAAVRQFNLAFLNPGKNFLGRQRKMEWVVGYVSDKEKILYDFDGKKLNRKASSAGAKSENASVACQATDKAFQFQISIQAGRVTVESPICDHADTYESADRDLTKGKIGVKPNVEFIIR